MGSQRSPWSQITEGLRDLSSRGLLLSPGKEKLQRGSVESGRPARRLGLKDTAQVRGRVAGTSWRQEKWSLVL